MNVQVSGEGTAGPGSARAGDPRALTGRLRRAAAELNRLAQEFAQAHGLHPTDVQALAAIVEASSHGGAPMTPGRLADRLHLSSGAVSACVDRLERAGHIFRERDDTDRRVVHLHCAPRARALAHAYLGPLEDSAELTRDGFTAEQLRTVDAFLAALTERLVDLRGTAAEIPGPRRGTAAGLRGRPAGRRP